MPVGGILIFVGLYFYAATLYPGGSPVDANSVGYDWMHNYWCSLLNESGMNGMPNPARPVAILAMLVLCSSMVQFFRLFGRNIAINKYWQKIIPFFGSISMLFAFFMFTDYHDLLTIISSFFGLFAVLGIIVEIYNSELNLFKWVAILAIFLLGINNVIYYSECGINYLPFIQKITFIVVLGWVGGLTLHTMKLPIEQSSNQAI